MGRIAIGGREEFPHPKQLRLERTMILPEPCAQERSMRAMVILRQQPKNECESHYRMAIRKATCLYHSPQLQVR